MNPLTSQITASMITVYFIQYLKDSPWFPWLTQEKIALARVLGGVAALATTAGMHVVWQSATHTLTIGNLTLWTVSVFLWHLVGQFLLQNLVYHGMVRKPSSASAAPLSSLITQITELVKNQLQQQPPAAVPPAH